MSIWKCALVSVVVAVVVFPFDIYVFLPAHGSKEWFAWCGGADFGCSYLRATKARSTVESVPVANEREHVPPMGSCSQQGFQFGGELLAERAVTFHRLLCRDHVGRLTASVIWLPRIEFRRERIWENPETVKLHQLVSGGLSGIHDGPMQTRRYSVFEHDISGRDEHISPKLFFSAVFHRLDSEKSSDHGAERERYGSSHEHQTYQRIVGLFFRSLCSPQLHKTVMGVLAGLAVLSVFFGWWLVLGFRRAPLGVFFMGAAVLCFVLSLRMARDIPNCGGGAEPNQPCQKESYSPCNRSV